MGTRIRGRLNDTAIEFHYTECCAVKFAIGSGCQDGFIKKSLAEAYRLVPKRDWALLWVRTWPRTVNLAFVPNWLDFKFYAGLAIAERDRLRGGGTLADYVLPCRHKASEHIKALTSISLALASQCRN